MPSIITGYNYDIFISYRQKDNKGDRWVSEFVEALKTELESTFKEEISVYFDINPHDGLLETHDVDASLKDKLKCLVFIPIISRTYCDPKSFAWEHEFKAFVEQASQDKFGLKVKLPGGNVANRVLPVRIHDLDQEDIKLCESVLGGVLRGVEFVYKEPGVNRSLTPVDDEKININKTRYRNQINKVALAIKELILGLKTESGEPLSEKVRQRPATGEVETVWQKKEQVQHFKLNRLKMLLGVLIAAVLICAAIIVYPKIFKQDIIEKLKSSGERISVAVMPFKNMTSDTTWNFWQDGIQDLLITTLSGSEELKVRQRETINGLMEDKGITDYAFLTPSVANMLSRNLNSRLYINGTINQAGSTLRLNAQLSDSKTGEILKPFQLEGLAKEEDVFKIIDSLSVLIRDFLIISKLKSEVIVYPQSSISSTSPEAYRYFVYGQKVFGKRDFPAAIKLLKKAVELDSNLTYATLLIGFAYSNRGFYAEAKKWCLKAYNKREMMPLVQQLYTCMYHADLFETPYEAIGYFKQLQEIDDNWPHLHYGLGNRYYSINQYNNAVSELEKSLKMYDNLGIKPYWSSNYYWLGLAYHKTGQYRKERKLYKRADRDFPDEYRMFASKAILALNEGDTAKANEFISNFMVQRKLQTGASDPEITKNVGMIYEAAGILDKAEEYYQRALSMEPDSPVRLNNLAYFLVDNDRNIEEGMQLAQKVLELSPEDYNCMQTLGWGLFKQGRYQDALDILQKSWDLRMKNAIYDHSAFQHLEAAKKAVAGQK
jgi:tetratricopeptide (TPR) repeat protein